MRHILFILSIILLLSSTGYAQKEEKQFYKDYKSRSSKQSVQALLHSATQWKEKDPQEALKIVQEALGQSVAQGDAFQEAQCYILIGEINEGIQEWTLAFENFNRARKMLNNSKAVSEEYIRSLRGLGTANLKMGLYPEALKYFQEALQLSGRKDVSTLRLDISEVYYQMGKYQEALDVLQNDQKVKSKISSLPPDNRIQNQEAKINARLNNVEETNELFDNSLSKLRQTTDVSPKEDQSLQETKEEIASAYRSQKRYNEEIDLRNKSIAYNLESKNLVEVTKDKMEISKTLETMGNRSAALREIEEAAIIADSLEDNPREQAQAYLALADLYEKDGQNNRALDAMKKFSVSVSNADTLNKETISKKANLIRIQKDIEEFSKNVSIGQREETIEKATVFRQQLIIYGLLVLLAVIATTSYFIYKNARMSKTANQLLALKSLRSQMNPHFIFNALNSVNHFVAQQDERSANKFLSEFSQLMRLVLENSQEDFIPLHKELEILSLYMKLEHYRFRDKFDYTIDIDESLNIEALRVPPMLIQPYIENAVWHGLRYREDSGSLALRFIKEKGNLVVNVSDNGIGRERSAALKTEHQKKHHSTGLKNIRERLEILNKMYKTRYHVTISDPATGTGTDVRIYVPFDLPDTTL